MSTDEDSHKPSGEEEDIPDEPERRIERRWRPAPTARPVRDPSQDRSAPPASPDDEGESDSPIPSSSQAPSSPPDASAGEGVAEDVSPASFDQDPDGQRPPAGDPGDATISSNSMGEQPPETSSAPSSASGPPEGSAAMGQEKPSEPSGSMGDEGDPARTETEEQAPTPDASDADLEEARDEGKRINDDAFSDASDDSSWSDALKPDETGASPPRDHDASSRDENFFTDETRYSDPAEQVEEAIQDFAYRMNEDGSASTDWTPDQRKARRIATTFARLVSKVAEDMSYQRRPGDEFWDPRKIMRRQIDNRPLQHCKMDYTKRRLALLVDTSPSCADEAVFYSKIASGAMLRDDIDIFLCPNGHIDAKFDPDPMRFVTDDRGPDWDLEGRTVLYFTDWDGREQIVAHSRDCNLYWFDNCPPDRYWNSQTERYQRIRLRYRGKHFHCPDPDAFRSLVRKIRP